MIILRNIGDFLVEQAKLTRLVPGVFKKIEPKVFNAKTASLAAGATLTLDITALTNETFILPFIYGSGTFNVDCKIVGPDEKPIATFDSSILKLDPDKPFILNPVLIVPEGKTSSISLTNNTGAAVTNQQILVTGFRIEHKG